MDPRLIAIAMQVGQALGAGANAAPPATTLLVNDTGAVLTAPQKCRGDTVPECVARLLNDASYVIRGVDRLAADDPEFDAKDLAYRGKMGELLYGIGLVLPHVAGGSHARRSLQLAKDKLEAKFLKLDSMEPLQASN